MNNKTTITFVRHGDVHNPQQLFYGRLPRFGLSGLGRDQAQKAARHLATLQPDVIYSSPLLRARQTARILQAAAPADPAHRISKLITEVHVPWDGRPLVDLEAIDWNMYIGNKPPFDQPTDVLGRTLRFISRARKQYAGKHIVAVSHGDTVSFVLQWALELPITAEARRLLPGRILTDDYPGNCSISQLVFDEISAELPSSATYTSVNDLPSIFL